MAVEAAATIAPPRRPALRRHLGDIATAARLIAAVVIVAAGGAWTETWHHLASMIILAVLTWPVRAVRWGTLFNLFLIGTLTALVCIGVQWVLESLILGGRFEVFRSVWIAPITEEPLKVLPLLLVVAVSRWPFRHGFGAVDLMLCGFALGAGFAVVEDTARAASGFPSPVTPSLFGVPVFLDSYNGFVGHGGSTAFIALAVGWGIWCLRWKKLVLAAPIVVASVAYWMMADHGLSNWAVHRSVSSWPAIFRWTWTLDRQGSLAPYILLAAILLTMIAERAALWWVLRPMRRLGPRAALAMVFRPLKRELSYGSVRAVMGRARRLMLYVLSLRQIGFFALHLKGDRPIDRRPIHRLLSQRAKEVAAVHLAARSA